MLPISLEFFPPKTPEGSEKLRAARQQLYALKPEFCSVTYGAGGSTHAGHFSCIGATRARVRDQLAQLRTLGVKRLVALRGDLPSGYGIGGEFQYASELVEFIRAETGGSFRIEVACYPEVHPQAKSPQSDVEAFVRKVRAGADSAITQYFYNADSYFRFVDEVRKLGVDVPIVPGIMPITNSSQLLRFSDASGAEIPRWIRLRLQSFGDDAKSIKAFGQEVVADLCQRLERGGAPGRHFYTMNQAQATMALCEALGRC
jgi:methylenetetrahydrofolate reductase (NADPH)